MAKPKDLKFKPYVGHFFQFVERVRNQPRSAIVGKRIYGNSIKNRTKFNDSSMPLPQSVLVVDEKRNNVKFLSTDNEYYWTTKAQLEPIDLPTYEGNPIPMLTQFRDFLIYCTDTKISEFQIEKMTRTAMRLLPKIDAMIENYKMNIIPK